MIKLLHSSVAAFVFALASATAQPLPQPDAQAAALLTIRFQPAILNDTDFFKQWVHHVMCADAERALGTEFSAGSTPDQFLQAIRPQVLTRARQVSPFYALSATGSLGSYDIATQSFPVSSPLQGHIFLRHSQPPCSNPFTCTNQTPTATGALVWPLGAIETSTCTRGGAAARGRSAAAGPSWPDDPAGERWYFVALDQDLSQTRVAMPPDAAQALVQHAGRNLKIAVEFEVTGIQSANSQTVTLTGRVRHYRLAAMIGDRTLAEYTY